MNAAEFPRSPALSRFRETGQQAEPASLAPESAQTTDTLPREDEDGFTVATHTRVVAVAPGTVWVEAASQGCAACGVQSRCGVAGLGRFFGRGRAPVALACDLPVAPGEPLVVTLAERELLRAGVLAYLVPPLLAVAAAVAAAAAGAGDTPAIAAMAAGFAAGLVVARATAHAARLHVSRPTDFPTPGDAHD